MKLTNEEKELIAFQVMGWRKTTVSRWRNLDLGFSIGFFMVRNGDFKVCPPHGDVGWVDWKPESDKLQALELLEAMPSWSLNKRAEPDKENHTCDLNVTGAMFGWGLAEFDICELVCLAALDYARQKEKTPLTSV